MSHCYNTYTTHGFGFWLWDLKEIDADAFASVICHMCSKEIRERVCSLLDRDESTTSVDDLRNALKEMTDCDDEVDIGSVIDAFDEFDDYGFASLLADMLNDITGLTFDAICDDEHGHAIMFCEKKPWEYTDLEKNMTEERLTEIIDGFINCLGCEQKIPVGDLTCVVYG